MAGWDRQVPTGCARGPVQRAPANLACPCRLLLHQGLRVTVRQSLGVWPGQLWPSTTLEWPLT